MRKYAKISNQTLFVVICVSPISQEFTFKLINIKAYNSVKVCQVSKAITPP